MQLNFNYVYIGFKENYTKDYVLHELKTVSIPIDAGTCCVTLISIYFLMVADRTMRKTVDNANTFTNTMLLTLLLAFIDLQRLGFKIFVYMLVNN